MQRKRDMKNLTTPQAVLGGLALIALAIASIPYSSNIVTPAHAAGGIQKVAICDVRDPSRCVPHVKKTGTIWMKHDGVIHTYEKYKAGPAFTPPKNTHYK
jgi:hypothetical protein